MSQQTELRSKSEERAAVVKAATAAAPKPLTFWEQYRRKPQGMVGLGIVIVYFLVAIFAPWIAPYDPMEDLYLADRLAAPAWITKTSAKFKDAPPTMRTYLGVDDWVREQVDGVSLSSCELPYFEGVGTEIVLPQTHPVEEEETPEEDPWSAEGFWVSSDVDWDPFGLLADDEEVEEVEEPEDEYGFELEAPAEETIGASEGKLVLSHSQEYDYMPPKTFSFGFDYTVDAPSSAETTIMLELVTPDGQAFDVWDAKIHGSVESGKALVDARDYDLKMRLGIGFFDEPTDVVFSQRGTYTVRLSAWTDSKEGPVTIKTTPVKFEILGLVHGVLGTDHMGSDLWSQLIHGTRIALAIGLSSAFIAIVLGTTVGLCAGYFGGVVDEVLMRIADVMMSLPTLPVLIILGSLIGKSVGNIVILLAIFAWMGIARLVRSQTLSLKERMFVEAARASGASGGYIMREHILPNVMPLIFANLVLRIPGAILTEASLSFLGLGDPRVPTWGRMMQNARQFGGFTRLAWWWLIPPGLALTFLSLAFVLIGNSVNEIYNPRYRERA
ncbi:MAG: ABC transporter permease subunit [Bacillota bacterium]|nr:ABC transporter permease [Bacillota bacterium]